MKTLIRTTIFSTLLGGLLFAQAQAGPAGRAFGRQQMGPGAAMRARAGGMGQLMAGYLGLTDAQKTQLQEIRQNARAQAQPIQEQLRQNRQELQAATKAGQPVDAIAAQQGKLLGDLIAIRARTQQQFRALLTPEQQAKLDQFENRRGKRRSAPQAAKPANL
jgi:Spy/CpxP family protein refolding chaperone